VIVLDTHALIWWVTDDKKKLSSKAAKAIKQAHANSEILISSISGWEIAMLVTQARIALSMDMATWLATVAEIKGVRFVPADNEILVKSVELPGDFHKDPADRIIVATARKFAVPVITAGEKIRAYPHVKSIW
jgi:PIN domain nuclease of toxin-antitoxin system